MQLGYGGREEELWDSLHKKYNIPRGPLPEIVSPKERARREKEAKARAKKAKAAQAKEERDIAKKEKALLAQAEKEFARQEKAFRAKEKQEHMAKETAARAQADAERAEKERAEKERVRAEKAAAKKKALADKAKAFADDNARAASGGRPKVGLSCYLDDEVDDDGGGGGGGGSVDSRVGVSPDSKDEDARNTQMHGNSAELMQAKDTMPPASTADAGTTSPVLAVDDPLSAAVADDELHASEAADTLAELPARRVTNTAEEYGGTNGGAQPQRYGLLGGGGGTELGMDTDGDSVNPYASAAASSVAPAAGSSKGTAGKAKAKPPLVVRCPNGNRMELSTYDQEAYSKGWYCNNCTAHDRAHVPRYFSLVSRWDYCTDCAHMIGSGLASEVSDEVSDDDDVLAAASANGKVGRATAAAPNAATGDDDSSGSGSGGGGNTANDDNWLANDADVASAGSNEGQGESNAATKPSQAGTAFKARASVASTLATDLDAQVTQDKEAAQTSKEEAKKLTRTTALLNKVRVPRL